MNQKKKRDLQKKIELTNWIVLAILLFLSGALTSRNVTIGILGGGLISIANFHGLCRSLRKVFLQPGHTAVLKAPVMVKYFLRMILTGLALYILLVKTTANIFGLVIGLSVVVVGIVFTVLMTSINERYLEEV